MLFYNFDRLDDFIKDNLEEKLKTEKENLENLINLYHDKKANFLAMTTTLIANSDAIDKKKLDHFYQVISLLKQSFENISTMQELIAKLQEDLEITIALTSKQMEDNMEEIKANLVEYNKQRDELSAIIMDFEKTSTYILNSAITLSFPIPDPKASFSKDKNKGNTSFGNEDNNVLIISEKEQKAYLPFFHSDIEKILETSNQYNTLQEVINDLYVVPLNKFKNSTMARLKEAFNLIRKKENGTITQGLDLGVELMFKYELNPVIIAACRNLDELDIYLDCLEKNELSDFSCFEIKFEVMPQLAKKK